MEHLRTIKPTAAQNLGNAPPNLFMPKAENLVNMKKPRADPEKAADPVLLTKGDYPTLKNHELWFK